MTKGKKATRPTARKGRKAAGGTKLTKPTAAAVRDIVKKTMMREAQTKFVSSYPSDATPNAYTNFNSTIVGPTQWGLGLPDIVQGDTDYNRQGDTIKPRQHKVALDIRFTAGSLGFPHDVTVVVYYGVCKKFKSWTDVQTNSLALCDELLRLGGVNGAGEETQSFNGIQSDSHLSINTDVWNLKKVTFRLNKAPGVLNGAAGAGVLSQGNKASHAVLLDYASFLPAELKYDTSTAQIPVNYAPVWSIGYYYNDPTAPDTGLTGICEYKANRFLTYKDF